MAREIIASRAHVLLAPLSLPEGRAFHRVRCGESFPDSGRSWRACLPKNYRPPHPKGMKGGCSPQNNLCLRYLSGGLQAEKGYIVIRHHLASRM